MNKTEEKRATVEKRTGPVPVGCLRDAQDSAAFRRMKKHLEEGTILEVAAFSSSV